MKADPFKLTLLCCAFLCVQFSFSQSVEVKTQLFNDENGLSRYANYIHKDGRANIWVGTSYGLYRFDRQDFMHFDDDAGLPFRQIMEIYEDAEGWFWLYKSCWRKGKNCKKDLAFFHPVTQEVLTFEERFGKQTTISADQIESIIQDSLNFYFTANHKLIKWSPAGGIREKEIKGFTDTPILFSKISTQILGAFYSANIISEPAQFIALDTNGFVQEERGQKLIPAETVNAFYNLNGQCQDYSEIRIENLAYSFSISGGLTIDTLSFEMPNVGSRGEDMELQGRFYASDSGELFHPDFGRITDLTPFYSPAFHRQNSKRIAVNNVWIKKREDSGEAFPYLLYNTSGRGSLYDESTQTQWKASRAGVKVVEFKAQYFQHINNPISPRQLTTAVLAIGKGKALLNIDQDLFYYEAPDQLRILSEKITFGGQLQVLGHDYDEASYWGACRGELVKINETEGVVAKYKNKEIKSIKSLLAVGRELWIGCGYKIIRFNKQSQEFEIFDSYNEFGAAKSEQVRCLLEKDENHIWILTDNHLYLCSKEQGIVSVFGDEKDGLHLEEKGRFNQILKARDGGWWVTSNQGVFYFSLTGEKVERLMHYQEENGLPKNEVFSVFEDDFGFLWMNTPYGLIQFQTQTRLSKLYTKADGLSSVGLAGDNNVIGPGGLFYFGGINGFNVFDPKDFKEVVLSQNVPLVILDYEQYSGQSNEIEYCLQGLLEKERIILAPGDKFFNIRVALTDYRDAEFHRFAYKIEGFHEDWFEDKSNLIRISGLPYGQYVLKIKGQLHNGLWSSAILEIPVQVLRPFYLRSWFFVAAAAFFLLLATLFYKWRVKKLKEQRKILEQEVANATQTIRIQHKELKQLDSVKSRFFANVSHELRTPITLILGPLNSIFKSDKLSARERSFASLGLKNAQKLLNLTNEILDLTKMESGNIELNKEAVAFYPYLGRIAGNFEGAAQQKNIQYNFDYQLDKDIALELDAPKTEKLINNLLSNAFKFTPRDGQITILAENGGPTIRLQVADSGRGVHADDLPYIFDRYYQSSQADTPKEGGFGIGLSLSMEFAKLMNGKLSAKSRVGEGSTFTFEFPKEAGVLNVDSELENDRIKVTTALAVGTAAASPLGELPAVSREPATILLVEDNDNLREYIELIIGDHFEIISAENGRIAWELLTTAGKDGQCLQPDLIISDIMMPEMDGYQLLSKLKEHSKLLSIPVIMLTALVELRDKLKALRIGVDDYITKPFEEEELLARVNNLLRNSRERKKFYLGGVQKQQSARVKMNTNSPKKVPKASINQDDLQWLEELEAIIKSKLGNTNFKIDDLPSILFMSRTNLYLRIKQLTGLTPNQYLREIRLYEAKILLESQARTSVKATALEIGFRDATYFSKIFRQRFGKLPSEYI